MGQYSLDNYEVYKTYKVRPKPLHHALDNIGRGQVHFVIFTWSELEPVRGDYHLDKLNDVLSNTMNALLILEPQAPAWISEHKEECFARLVRRIGSNIGNLIQLMGVMITSVNQTKKEWNAYIEAFNHIPIIADIHNSELIQYLQAQDVDFGLFVSCNEENWMDRCESFARHHLQSTWERKPVILQVEEESCGIHVAREAFRWHAGLSNRSMDLGYRIELRRLTYPKSVTSQGMLPLRFWYVNSGTAPCYQDFGMKIRLQREDKTFILPIQINSKKWLPGDITHNELVKLPELDNGVYSLSIGLFFHDDTPIKLSIEGDCEDGFYTMGHIDVDEVNRDEFHHIWDGYYPEGYYPLEDPKEPNL